MTDVRTLARPWRFEHVKKLDTMIDSGQLPQIDAADLTEIREMIAFRIGGAPRPIDLSEAAHA